MLDFYLLLDILLRPAPFIMLIDLFSRKNKEVIIIVIIIIMRYLKLLFAIYS